MTEGEKMVWAAAFVHAYEKELDRGRPREFCAEWATVHAFGVVESMNAVDAEIFKPGIRNMLKEMRDE